MNKAVVRILMTIGALVLLYLGVVIIASVAQLADAADRIYLGSGQAVFWVFLTALAVLLVTPLVLFYRLPRPLLPPAEPTDPRFENYLGELRHHLEGNPRLTGVVLGSREDIEAAMAKLSMEADKVIRDTASTVFVSTAVMQNGRLDGLIVLATQLRMVWRIASIYYQRPTPRQVLYLYSNVGAAALIADSIQEIEFSELAAPLVTAIIPSLKGAIPGLQGVANLLVNSIASGAANAFLTLRVGIVARQYCESLTTPKRRDVRQSATASALVLVGQITKENGARVAQNSWGAVRDAVGGAVDSAVEGAKNVTDKAVDATVSSARTVGDAIASTTRGVLNAAGKIAPKKEPT